MFSAHGVPPRVREEATERSLRVIDATCPLVTKVHLEARKFARESRTLILIGHRDHQEIVGTSGEAPQQTVVVGSVEEVDELQVDDPEKLAYLTQTTLSLYDTQEIVARLRQRFPKIVGPASDDICYATQNRQEAVEALTREVDLILVVGSANSSNSNRLVEVAQRAGVAARLIDDAKRSSADVVRGSVAAGTHGGRFGAGDSCRAGEPASREFWLHGSARPRSDSRRRAIHVAAGTCRAPEAGGTVTRQNPADEFNQRSDRWRCGLRASRSRSF